MDMTMIDTGKRQIDLHKLIWMTALGQRISEISAACDISPSTIIRRRRDPSFMVQVREVRTALLDGAVGKLTNFSADAVDTIKSLLSSQSENVRLSASRAMLEHAAAFHKLSELVDRVDAIERELVNRSTDAGIADSTTPAAPVPAGGAQ